MDDLRTRKGGLCKKALKSLVANAIGFICGISSAIYLKNTLTVFVYHDVSEVPSEFSTTYNLNVPPRIFDFQIRFIKKKFNIISPTDLMQSNVPSRAALITFDDGFRSYFTKAIPILEALQVPSIIFLNMEPIIRGAVFWAGLITYLSEKDGNFKKYMECLLFEKLDDKDLYLSCSKDIVESYISTTGKSYDEEVYRFVGDFATQEDLMKNCSRKLVSYGSHLFNHEVPLLLSDQELLDSYCKNSDELRKYQNYINMFSLPFGQPGTCYSDHQVRLLFQKGAKIIFNSCGLLNLNSFNPYLQRIPLYYSDNTHNKIWFRIFKNSLIRKKGK